MITGGGNVKCHPRVTGHLPLLNPGVYWARQDRGKSLLTFGGHFRYHPLAVKLGGSYCNVFPALYLGWN